MHPDFADWYRRVHIEPREDDLAKRWQGIETFHKKATALDLLDATRLFFGLPLKDGEFLARYRTEFKTADGSFAMRDNDAEMQVLAGATLANHFDSGDDWAKLSGLSLACGSFGGIRKAPVPEIVDLARRILRAQSASLRANKKTQIPGLDLGDKLQNLKTATGGAGGNTQAIQGPLMEVLQPLVKAVMGLTSWAKQAKVAEELRQEESDILWWLFGAWSRDLSVPFDQLKAPSGCIIGAKEAADLTHALPGPFGIEAYLSKMIDLAHPNLDGEASLSDAIIACPLGWQKQFLEHGKVASVADLCPIHLASQKYIEGGGKKSAWHALFQSASGLKTTTKLKPVDLAVQTYRERLLTVAIDRIQESSDE